jgi:hypothetical protein
MHCQNNNKANHKALVITPSLHNDFYTYPTISVSLENIIYTWLQHPNIEF